jgi:hypothetical protein
LDRDDVVSSVTISVDDAVSSVTTSVDDVVSSVTTSEIMRVFRRYKLGIGVHNYERLVYMITPRSGVM